MSALTPSGAGEFEESNAQAPKRAPPREQTFEAFANEWKKVCVIGGGLTESQIESDVSILSNHLLPFFSSMQLAEIRSRDIDRYKAAKRSQRHQYGVGYAAKSINNQLSVLHRIFDKAIEYELLDRNPVTKRAWMKRERTSEDSLNWWTPQEERKAVATLERWRERYPQRRLIILVQVMTGMRFSEIRSLNRTDVDLSIPGLWVRRSQARKKVGTPKSKRARFQVIPKALAEELELWLDLTEGIGDLLFTGTKGGVLANNSLNRWYRKLADEAGIRRISSHGARHTSGSTYATMGMSQKMIAKLLGHATTKATERYTHIQVTETRGAVEARWARIQPKSESA